MYDLITTHPGLMFLLGLVTGQSIIISLDLLGRFLP